MPTDLRRILLHSHLYGRAQDIFKNIPFARIESRYGVDVVRYTFHYRDALSVVSNVQAYFLKLLSTKPATSEAYFNCESRFSAPVSKHIFFGSNLLPESFTSFMLFANRNIDSNQRNSILQGVPKK